jgi:D-3-phosphoglycerate dehydrogenase
MHDTVDPLVSDLLEWIGAGRPYAEVMDAWRTSCPRLPVWEEANARGYLESGRRDGVQVVVLTDAGRQRLAQLRDPYSPAASSSRLTAV